ncbi:MAG: hypothetical protein M1833_001231 [Piccolia ochrophora]|nr:MAG: hypothetical protein M1833_001231 [Piccolia ochrophora]
MDSREDRGKPQPKPEESSGYKGPSSLGIFFIVVAVFFIVAVLAVVIHGQLRARRLGLPRPTLASYNPFKSSSSRNYPSAGGGVGAWFSDKLGALKNRRGRTSDGGYEEPLTSGAGAGGDRGRRSTRGFDTLDPDGAWDTRVGTEADAYGPGGYYEEQELGLHGGGASGPYGGSGYGGQSGIAATPLHAPPGYGDDEAPRGRSRSREPGAFIGGSQAGLDNRYDEEMGNKPSRDPFGDQAERSEMPLRGLSPRPLGGAGHQAKGSHDDGASERRSMFREAM